MLVVEGGGFLGKPEVLVSKHGGINEAFKDRLLVCSPVKNKVVLVNPEIDSSLDLKQKEESSLPLFVRSAFPYLIKRKQGEQLLEGWSGHERSTLFTRKKFKDKQGRWYRDVDFKGNGYVRNGTVELPGGVARAGLVGVPSLFGLLEIKEAFKEYEKSEEFLAAGIRAPRILAIINLEEIIYGGGKLSLEKARERGIINKDFQPAILVRAFGTRARPRDISEGTGLNKETKKVILEDAKELVGEELGRGKINPLTNAEYLDWFAGTLGYNVGMVHRRGDLHGLLSGHNVTLDVRLCDLDTVEKIKNNKERLDEIRFARNHSLKGMVSSLKLSESCFYIAANNFQRSYYSAFHEGERRYGW
ncbi:hypothetical protein KJ980_06850 [Patescibacteria group bacterium]|nr:hypothetical protein [Patescibacteria group bacterium]MBU4016948.1 hypothetical protein [Patescibacteria group bacterium]MBU4099339.1 hypothetical protein [Patescibacteria group bacterium]